MNAKPSSPSPVNDNDGVAIRPIQETLARLREGRIYDLMSLELNKVVKAVRDTGKAGKMTLTIDVKPVKKIAGALELTAEVNGKLPKLEASSDLMFPDEDGNLYVRPPNQRDIFEDLPRPV